MHGDHLVPAELEGSPGEKKFTQATLAIVAAEVALADTTSITDTARRIALLEPMVNGPDRLQRPGAIFELGECGPAAVPLLEKMLVEYGEVRTTWSERSWPAPVRAGGEARMTGAVETGICVLEAAAPSCP